MSWGRHGWPRTNESMRLYREREGSYLIIDVDAVSASGYDGIANALNGPEPSLASTTIGRDYTYKRGCKRVQWSELPKKWQRAFRPWLNVKPEEVRGFWLVGQQPEKALAVSERR